MIFSIAIKKKILAIALTSAMAVTGVSAVSGATASASDSSSLWALKANGKTVAYVKDREAGEAVITGLRVKYFDSIALQQSANVETLISIEKVDEDVPVIVDSSSVKKTVDSIAKNDAKNTEDPSIKFGYSGMIKEEKAIKSKKKIIKIDSDKLEKGEQKVKKAGKNGLCKEESNLVVVNGDVVSKDVMNKEIIKKAKKTVVYEGTSLSAKSKGMAAVAFAKQYLGNQYVWGGESLEHGIDCSGFTMKIYEHYGISLPHYSQAQASCGEEVSPQEMQPGDLIIYPGHVAMYAGNGQIIHAAGESVGIIMSDDPHYSNILHVRRIFGTSADTSKDSMFPDFKKIRKAYGNDYGYADSNPNAGNWTAPSGGHHAEAPEQIFNGGQQTEKPGGSVTNEGKTSEDKQTETQQDKKPATTPEKKPTQTPEKETQASTAPAAENEKSAE